MNRARRAMTRNCSRAPSGSVAAALPQLAFDVARAIDDARKAARQHAEKYADAGEQEHGRQRELDRMGDVDDFQSIHFAHLARRTPPRF